MKRFKTMLLIMGMGVLSNGLLTSTVQAATQDEQAKPTTLTFKYTGDSCDAWFTNEKNKGSCRDHPSVAAEMDNSEVHVVAHQQHGKRRVWFDGIVEQNKNFTIDSMNGERITFTGGGIVFEIFDLQGHPLQTIEIPTKADALVTGDVYGGLILKKVNYKFKVPREYEDFSQYIVTFNAGSTWDEITEFAEYWESYGLTVAMALPLTNALVLKLPAYVLPEEVADDPRVISIEYDQELGVRELLDGQGRSFIRPLNHEPARSNRTSIYEYPWSILKLYDQPYQGYSTDSPSGWLEEDAVPESIRFALKQLDKAKIKIAVFDTGVEKNHKKASRTLKGGLDVVNGRNNNGKFKSGKPIDDNGHGTHVAGILAAVLDEKYEWGKGADIEVYAVKILDQYATGKLSNILMGLQWAINNEIDIVNMSIGYRHASPAIQQAIHEISQAGIILVASVGNHSNYDDSIILGGSGEGGAGEGGAGEGGAGEGGAGEGGAGEGGAGEGGAGEGGAGEGGAGEGGAGEGGAGEGGAGEGGAGEGGAREGGAGEGGAGEGGFETQPLPLYSVMFPARYPEVIAVGASNQWGELAPFSNAGEEMDIMAPGTDILSWDITNEDIKEGLGSSSGTSMSTPYVTAAVAMMLALDPTLDAQEIRDILKQTADYYSGELVGDLNLEGALTEVMTRLIGQDPSDFDRKELKKMYREKLKEKIESVGDTLWE